MSELIEVYSKTNADIPATQLAKSYLGEFAPNHDFYYHIAYIHAKQKNEIVYLEIQDMDFNSNISNQLIVDKLKQDKCQTPDKVAYILATHGIVDFQWDSKLIPHTEQLQELTRFTNGYLIYRSQIETLYQYLTGCNEKQAHEFSRNWNKRDPKVRESTKHIKCGQKTLWETIIEYNPRPKLFFLSEPKHQAKKVWEYLGQPRFVKYTK